MLAQTIYRKRRRSMALIGPERLGRRCRESPGKARAARCMSQSTSPRWHPPPATSRRDPGEADPARRHPSPGRRRMCPRGMVAKSASFSSLGGLPPPRRRLWRRSRRGPNPPEGSSLGRQVTPSSEPVDADRRPVGPLRATRRLRAAAPSFVARDCSWAPARATPQLEPALAVAEE